MLEIVDCSRERLLRLAAQESEDLLDEGARQGALTLERAFHDKGYEAAKSYKAASGPAGAHHAREGPRVSNVHVQKRTNTTKTQALVELFTQAEGKCNWIPIEAPYKTPSRYMEFFLPSSGAADPEADSLATGTAAAASSRSGKNAGAAHARHPGGAFGDAETKKPCALCASEFPVSSLNVSVSRQAIYRLRQKWAKQFGSTGCEHVEKKFRFRLYDELRVCLFCSQLFNDFGGGPGEEPAADQIPKPKSPRRRAPAKDADPILVTVVGKARLEEIFFEKLAAGERDARPAIRTVRTRIRTPDALGYPSKHSAGPSSARATCTASGSRRSSAPKSSADLFACQPSPPSIPKPIRTPPSAQASRSKNQSKAHPHLSP